MFFWLSSSREIMKWNFHTKICCCLLQSFVCKISANNPLCDPLASTIVRRVKYILLSISA